jgi:protocatechuate 3,4-dioxygenase beta subunit
MMLAPRSILCTALVFCILVFTPALYADGAQTGTLEGRVLDASGSPLSGVAINLSGPQGGASTVTDEDGNFRFGLLVPGEYTVGATLEGMGSSASASSSRSAGRPRRPSPSPLRRR